MSKELTPKDVIKDSETDCNPKIILNKNQWETVYNWCDEYHGIKSKPLIDEIASLTRFLDKRCSENNKLSVIIHGKENEIAELKSKVSNWMDKYIEVNEENKKLKNELNFK